MWYLMIRSIQLGYSYTVTLILALPAAAFMVRLFILFHDCVHGSFFRQQGANTFFGYFLGACWCSLLLKTGASPTFDTT
jgi:omega-6 fatty acid desaturase (delta-12 desaturase)